MAYIRKVKTTSNKTAIQVCWKEKGKIVKVVHVGSAQSEEGVKKLKKKAQALIDEGNMPLFDLSEYDGV